MERVSYSEGARRLGMSAPAFGVWAKKPGAPVEDGKALWPAFPKWWGDQREAGGKRTVAKRPVSDAKERLEQIAAELKEYELGERRKQLMTVDQASRIIDDAFARAASKLENLRFKIAMIVTGATVKEREKQSGPLIDEVQAELAAGEDVPAPGEEAVA